MTHTDRSGIFGRPLLAVLACLLALVTVLGVRAPTARADDGSCALFGWTLVPTGMNGHDLTQPPGTAVGLSIHTTTGDTVGSSCIGIPLTFDWTLQSPDAAVIAGTSGLDREGPQATFYPGSDNTTVTISVQGWRGPGVPFGGASVTLSFVDPGPSGTTVAAAPAVIDAGQSSTLSSTTTPDYLSLRSILWDFGDGTPTVGVQPVYQSEDITTSVDHLYQSPGDYTASVTVTDFFGKTATVEQTVHVRAPLAGGFTVSPPSAAVGDPVSVDGSAASTEPGATISGWAWDFGDDHTGTGATADHGYSAPGTYTITETVTDSLGRTATFTHDVTVQAAPAAIPPVAAWRVTTAVPTTAGPTAFDGTGSTDDGSITAYDWSFGDGLTGTGATPQHSYTTAGTYTVVLTVTDEAGLTDSATHSVTVADVAAPPSAAFTVNPSSLVAGSAVSFDASPSSEPGGVLTGYSWTFGDGSTSTQTAPQHTYTTAGTYPVTLTVTDSRGRTATTARSLAVHWKATDLAVSVSGSSPRAGLYTYRVTVRNLGTAAAHGVVLLSTPDSTQVLASAPGAPAGIRCAGVPVGATGTITCTANPATVLAAGRSWTVTYTVRQPSLPRPHLAVEISQVKAVNPDPIAANNTARLSTSVGRRL